MAFVKMGTLYVVATPIGNLQDITYRAVKILQTVDAIACEDTRKTGMLLKFIKGGIDCHAEFISAPKENEILKPFGSEAQARSGEHEGYQTVTRQVQDDKKKTFLISYYEQNEKARIPEIINFLKNGMNLALVSDAGTPTVSDPGFKLVRECIKEGIKVESIPGPSSVISALVVSGLPTDKFLFVGYPPHKEGHRRKLYNDVSVSLSAVKSTLIMFEAPHKILRTLEELKEIFKDINIVICRELTKMHEEIRREKISESIVHFEKVNPKGEFVILFNLGEQENNF